MFASRSGGLCRSDYTGHSVCLTLGGGFLPCPLVPQYVQASWSFDSGSLTPGLFCFFYELPATASVACGSSRRDADRFPATFASTNLRICSRVHVVVLVSQKIHLYLCVI